MVGSAVGNAAVFGCDDVIARMFSRNFYVAEITNTEKQTFSKCRP